MLTINAVKAAKPKVAPYKLFDGGGLFLYVAPTGLKSWRLKYRIRGREKLLTFGRFPELKLAEARAKREEAKETLRAGRDPGSRTQASNTFEELARAWHTHSTGGWSDRHADDVVASLERDVFPAIGSLSSAAVSPDACLRILRGVEDRGNIASARRLRHRLSAIFRFGIAHGLISNDPAENLRVAMKPLPVPRPMRALLRIEDCRSLLAACGAIEVLPSIELASRFLAFTAVRLDAVRGAKWQEIEGLDGPAPLWIVPAARMKLGNAKKGDRRFDHFVPLSAAAVEVLRLAGPKDSGLIFPGRGGQCRIGQGALRDLYVRAGFEERHVPHGWRASFSTVLNNDLGPAWRDDIDRALAHVQKNLVEAAYNRAHQLDRRRTIMDRWGELLTN